MFSDLTAFATASLLVSLRIVPTLGFAPPFTLLRIPATVRLFMALLLSAWLIASHPEQMEAVRNPTLGLLPLAAGELLIGVALTLALQLAFAALLTVGRMIDLQAGYAFAMVADPTSRAQLPLVGMIFAYAAAALFFATGGPHDLLAIWFGSLEQVPMGGGIRASALPALLSFISAIFVMALGAGGLLLTVLFLIDLAIALMSRTLPQMNVLFLGFQVKTLATLVLLPIAVASSAALYLRMVRFALETMLRLI